MVFCGLITLWIGSYTINVNNIIVLVKNLEFVLIYN